MKKINIDEIISLIENSNVRVEIARGEIKTITEALGRTEEKTMEQ